MFISDQEGHYQYVNQAAINMLGFGREDLLQMSIADITPEEDLTAVWKEFRQLLTTGNLRSEFRLRTKGGTLIPIDFHGNVLHDGSLLGVCRDITQRKQMEDQVRQLAFYDNLTALANRRLFNDRLNQAILAGKRSGNYCALMFLDLDNFKPLNDLHGHKAGDLLLIEVARRMKACVRETDTIARFGGDEFVVLLVELTGELSTSVNEAARVAEKIRRAIGEVFVLTLAGEDHAPNLTTQHHCTASIGVAMIAASDVTAEDALLWADKAMYEAKEHGRNQVCFSRAATHSTTKPERLG
jgi:diguanylate cyclase (GGDEF)-like protein/PAS domain S-box-containing protein